MLKMGYKFFKIMIISGLTLFFANWLEWHGRSLNDQIRSQVKHVDLGRTYSIVKDKIQTGFSKDKKNLEEE